MTVRRSISWILNFVDNLPNDEERIKCLRANDHPSIRLILQGAFHPHIVWDLPEGDPPYKPCEYPHIDNMLWTETRRLYLFTVGGSPNLKPLKRESMYIDLLESVTPEDAKLLLAIKNKCLPYKNVTKLLVTQAFPGLIPK